MKNQNINFTPSRRLLTIALLITFLFIFIVAKLFYVQVVAGQKMQLKAFDQWTRELPLKATRGNIVDRSGNKLTENLSLFSVYVRPRSVKNPSQVADVLSKYLMMDYSAVMEKITKKNVSEVTIKKQVTKEVMQQLASYNLDGIYFSTDIKRYYPYGDVLSQVIGFTSVDSYGQTGVEAYYDKYLRGVDGKKLTETDLIGQQINGGSLYIPAIDGAEVRLTVDVNIQRFVEKIVKETYLKKEAKMVSCIVLNPQNSEILAMCEAPTFDLNNVPRDDVDKLFETSKNNLVSSVYEPGSTFKILTSAIGLETGVISPDDRFFCAGNKLVDGQKIRCWKPQGHGSQDFSDGVKNSCNCVFMETALRVGVNTYYDYLDKFGVLKKTGVDMVGEACGLFLKKESVKNVDLARIGFGQAIAVTPLSLINSVATVINGGISHTPHVVSSIYDYNLKKNTYVFSEKNEKRIISESTSKALIPMLERVVTEGSGKPSYIAGYRIGGKTGTAQKYENGAIAQGKYISSFVGFAPLENPKYLVLFIVDEPKGLYYGSQVCAPPVGELFRNIFDYASMYPTFSEADKMVIGEKFPMPDLVGKKYSEVKNILYKLGLHFEVDGDGDVVTEQYPAKNTMIDKRYSVMLYT